MNKSKETITTGGRVGGLSAFHGWPGETENGCFRFLGQNAAGRC